MQPFSVRALVTSLAVAGGVLISAPPANAVPFTVNAVLTGDFRADSPDNLFVNVTVTGDTTSNVANWVVAVNSPAHPSARLDVFALNVALGSGQSVLFSNFSPSTWSITSGDNVPGSGGADFRFETNDPPGSSNNVTNSVNLTFRMTLVGGLWSASNFLNAPLSDGGGILDPGAQLGAHLQSLSTTGCSGCSSGGFASGNFGGTPSSSVPEPATLFLYGLGLLGVAAVRRRH